jgi:hypothetical protein
MYSSYTSILLVVVTHCCLYSRYQQAEIGRAGTSRHQLLTKGFETKMTDLKLKLEKLTKKQGFAQLIERGKWYYEHDEHQEIIATLHRYLGIFQMSLSVGGM